MEEQQALSPDTPAPTFTELPLQHPEDTGQTKHAADEALLAQALQGIQQISTEMHLLKEDFDTKIKYDESKERVIDALHQELQSYREGLHFKILRPLFIDLIALHDDVSRILEDMGRNFPSIDTTITANIRSFLSSIEETLNHNGVEAFQVEAEIFVANKQHVLKTQVTTDHLLDKHIARRIRKGFLYDNRILRPEFVETYRAVAAQ